MRYTTIILIFSVFSAFSQSAQFQMSRTADNARNAALGGQVISLSGDVTQFYQNPALLDSVESGAVAFTYNPYFADIHAFSGIYKFDLKKLGSMAAGIRYFSYGDFEQREANGDLIGTFGAADYQLVVGKSHRVQSFVLGAALKFSHSNIENYSSSALLFDLGGTYQHPTKDLTFALLFSDFGFVINDYLTSSQSQVPFDVQIGTSFKPEHMPFRFSITAYHLVNENLIFDEDEETNQRLNGTLDNMMRRVSIGAELLLSDNVQLLMGYNHLRRQELKLMENAGGAGLSFGLLVGIKRFQFRYAYSRYNQGGGASFFTIQSNLRSFRKSI